MVVVNGKDDASLVQALQQENTKLKAELEFQYNQAIKMAETLQTVHLARIKEAMKEMQSKSSPVLTPEEFKKELDSTSSTMEKQQQGIIKSRQIYAQQAEQLRALEDRARKWAKKYLSRIKAAACKAEAEAGVPSQSPSAQSTSSLNKPQKVKGAASAAYPPASSPATNPGSVDRTSSTGRNGILNESSARSPFQHVPSSHPINRTSQPVERPGARSRLLDPIGRPSTRTSSVASEPVRRSTARRAEDSERSSNRQAEKCRRSSSRPAESTVRSHASTSDSGTRRSLHRPSTSTARSLSRTADTSRTRSVCRTNGLSRRSATKPSEVSRQTVHSTANTVQPFRKPWTFAQPAGSASSSRRKHSMDISSMSTLPSYTPAHWQDPESKKPSGKQQSHRQTSPAVMSHLTAIEKPDVQPQKPETEAAEPDDSLLTSITDLVQATQIESACELKPQAGLVSNPNDKSDSIPDKEEPDTHSAADSDHQIDADVDQSSHSQGGSLSGTEKVSEHLPDSGNVAEALQVAQLENSDMDSMTVTHTVAGSLTDISIGGAHSVAIIRTNEIFQTLDAHDTDDVQNYSSDASASITSGGQGDKSWAGSKKKKGRGTTFLNRLFTYSKKHSES